MVEGDGARPRGAAHKICLHSPEKKSRVKKSDEEGLHGSCRREWRRTGKNKGGAENGGTVRGWWRRRGEPALVKRGSSF